MTDTISNYIHGRLQRSAATEFVDLVDPVTGLLDGRSPISTADEIDAAFDSAKQAFATWGRTTPGERQAALLDIASAVLAHRDELVDLQSRDTGQLKHFIGSEEIDQGVDQLRFFAGAARLLEGKSSGEYLRGHTSSIRREPVGVIAQITPWNYPFAMAIWKIAPAIAAGNTVVLKPSDTTPRSTIRLAELVGDVVGPGVLNVINGDVSVGRRMVEHPTPAMVAITGSVRAGTEVALSAAKNLKRAHLELGGKAPAVVFADADIAGAAAGIAAAAFFNAGQDCTAATRAIVHEAVYDEFVEALVEQAQGTRPGRPDDTTAAYGPLNNSAHLDKVAGFISRLPAHAVVQTGGAQVGTSGFYFEPTVITGVRQDDEVVQGEVFGPVITIQPFSDEEEAVAKANGVPFGLAASVWVSDHATAMRLSRDLDFGCVWLNTHIPFVSEMPHGGFGASGYGKDLSGYGLEDYTRIKHVMSALQ